MDPKPKLSKTSNLTTVLSWLGLISMILLGRNDRILYVYILTGVLFLLLGNSILFKLVKTRSVTWDFAVYHYFSSLSFTAALLISNLKLAPFHRVYRTCTKLYLFIPSWLSCPTKSQMIDDVPIRIYSPAVKSTDMVIVYFHGGMFCYYNQAIYHSLMCRIANQNRCKVVLCGQKLAPEYPFPNAVIESYQVLNWVQRNAAELGVNPRRVVVMGDSSGGALAAAVTLLHKKHQGTSLIQEEEGAAAIQPPIFAQVLISPLLQAFSYGPNSSLNDCSDSSAEVKSTFLSYYLAGNITFSSVLGTLESGDQFPPFWKALMDDAVKTRDPLSELSPSLDGIWNELAFPLMSRDLTDIPQALIIGYIEDDSFEDARYYSEWLAHFGVPSRFLTDYTGYHDNLLLHNISPSAKKTLTDVAEYLENLTA